MYLLLKISWILNIIDTEVHLDMGSLQMLTSESKIWFVCVLKFFKDSILRIAGISPPKSQQKTMSLS